MMTMKKALLVMLKAKLNETEEQEPRWDYQHWQQVGRIDALRDVIELVEAMKED